MTELAEPATAALAAPVPDRIATEATAVDVGETDLRPAVAEVIRSGGLHLGPAGVAAQARVLAGLAQECMSTAFSFWGHRMALEYLDRFGSSAHRELREDLAQGNRPASQPWPAPSGATPNRLRVPRSAASGCGPPPRVPNSCWRGSCPMPPTCTRMR